MIHPGVIAGLVMASAGLATVTTAELLVVQQQASDSFVIPVTVALGIGATLIGGVVAAVVALFRQLRSVYEQREVGQKEALTQLLASKDTTLGDCHDRIAKSSESYRSLFDINQKISERYHDLAREQLALSMASNQRSTEAIGELVKSVERLGAEARVIAQAAAATATQAATTAVAAAADHKKEKE